MRCRLTIIALLVLAGIGVVVMTPPAGGDANPGIKKEHLYPTPGDFVDDVPFRILPLNSLRIRGK